LPLNAVTILGTALLTQYLFSRAWKLDRFDPRSAWISGHGVYEYDNRDSAQMYEYMEARIDALKRRIVQLEGENDALRCKGDVGSILLNSA
jgi:hypothetical protein